MQMPYLLWQIFSTAQYQDIEVTDDLPAFTMSYYSMHWQLSIIQNVNQTFS